MRLKVWLGRLKSLLPYAPRITLIAKVQVQVQVQVPYLTLAMCKVPNSPNPPPNH